MLIDFESRLNGRNANPLNPFPESVDSSAVNPHPGFQRRRLPFGGMPASNATGPNSSSHMVTLKPNC